MNLDRKLFGRVTLNSQTVSLGHAPIIELAKRLIEQYRLAKSPNSGKVSILVEISHEQLSAAGLLSDEQRLMNEFNQLLSTSSQDEETDWPGITMSRVAEVSSTPEFQAYQLIATNPNKRLGLTALQIERIKLAYFAIAPDCAPHFPTWVDP